GSKTYYYASLQGACNRVTIVYYLYKFYASAGYTPSDIDIYYFSITCDILTAILFIY
ncbi:hypothetical protein P154DRAFT_424097, partial [Amniculicola lignicola CBS 123094]